MISNDAISYHVRHVIRRHIGDLTRELERSGMNFQVAEQLRQKLINEVEGVWSTYIPQENTQKHTVQGLYNPEEDQP